MRLLHVDAACWQSVETRAERWDAQKFEIILFCAVLLVDKLRGFKEVGIHDILLNKLYRVTHGADAFNLGFHNIAGFEKFGWVAGKADAAGRAGGDDVASFERHALGEDGDDAAHVEEHVGGGAFLLGDAVDAHYREMFAAG